MKKTLFQSCLVATMASFLFACNPDEQGAAELAKISSSHDAMIADKITFDNGATRDGSGFVTTVTSQEGALVTVDARQRFYSGAGNYSATNPGQYSTDNRANLFNTSSDPISPSDDSDLAAAANSGNALIINHNSNYQVPDDYAWGGVMSVNFSSMGTVTLNSLTYLDNEEGIIIRLYGSSDQSNLLYEKVVPGMGDAGDGTSQVIDLNNTAGVVWMEIIQGQGATPPNVPNGSGAIDDIMFTREVPETGCTRTQGYWKNHASDSKHYDDAWAGIETTNFFSSGETYYSILGVQPRGNAYYTLAHQYVATKLNLAAGATAPSAVMTAYNTATSLFMNNTPAQVAASKSLKDQFTQLAGILDAYNNGITGPGHCD